MTRRLQLVSILCFFVAVWGMSRPASAQTGFDQTIDEDVPLTIIRVDILTQGIDAGANPRRWGRAFDEIGITCRIRQGLADEVPSIAEEQEGRVRRIDVVGLLDRQGKLTFPDVSFTMADQVEFRNWFAELERYGVQGSPEGQSNWGLDEGQLIELLGHLAQPIQAETKGLPVRQVIDELPFPEGMEVRLPVAPTAGGAPMPGTNSTSTGSTVEFDSVGVVSHELNNFSLGTGLAILLADQGLGFHPVRNPDGSVDLEIIPLTADRDPWPIGWDIGDETPRDLIYPTLFEFFPINIQDVPLIQTLATISERSDVPILLDYRQCAAQEVDLASIRVTVVERQSAWGLVLRRVVAQARLTYDYRLDEADRPFVWIYPFVPYTPAETE